MFNFLVVAVFTSRFSLLTLILNNVNCFFALYSLIVLNVYLSKHLCKDAFVSVWSDVICLLKKFLIISVSDIFHFSREVHFTFVAFLTGDLTLESGELSGVMRRRESLVGWRHHFRCRAKYTSHTWKYSVT